MLVFLAYFYRIIFIEWYCFSFIYDIKNYTFTFSSPYMAWLKSKLSYYYELLFYDSTLCFFLFLLPCFYSLFLFLFDYLDLADTFPSLFFLMLSFTFALSTWALVFLLLDFYLWAYYCFYFYFSSILSFFLYFFVKDLSIVEYIYMIIKI